MIEIICGVDVASQKLDCCIVPGEVSGVFANTPEGIADLAAFCRTNAVQLVVMEATGSYEHKAFCELSARGFGVAVVNPAQVRHFAKAMGKLEKTDAIDALMIARFGLLRQPKPTSPASQKQNQLNGLVKRLRQITVDLAANKMRLAQAHDEDMRNSLNEVIDLLKAQAQKLEAKIAGLVDDDPVWQPLAAALCSLKGVALRSMAYILAELPEIGTYNNKAIAKLTGLAPIANDSGKKQGKRPVRGGRAGIRSIFFLIADIVRRFDPHFAAFHKRLTAQHKPKMVVRIALARKLAVVLNAKVRDARAKIANAT